MQVTEQLKLQLEDQASQLIARGEAPYRAYLNAYHTAELLKSFLLSLNRKEWKQLWKISYYFNTKAGLALESAGAISGCNFDASDESHHSFSCRP